MRSRVDMWCEQVGGDSVAHVVVTPSSGPAIMSSHVVGADRDWHKVEPVVIARYALRYGRTGAARAAVAKLPEADVLKWWASIGKSRRGEWRDKWEDSGKGFFDKLGDVVHDVTSSPITKVVFPVAALANVKNPARDAIVKNLPGGSQILAAERARNALLEHHDVISAAKQVAHSAAKSGALSAAAKSLGSPVVLAALTKAGVHPSEIAKTKHYLGAVRAGANAEAARVKGNTSAARAHVLAMAALAKKAGVPDSKVKQAANKVYYLTVAK